MKSLNQQTKEHRLNLVGNESHFILEGIRDVLLKVYSIIQQPQNEQDEANLEAESVFMRLLQQFMHKVKISRSERQQKELEPERALMHRQNTQDLSNEKGTREARIEEEANT